MKLRFYRNLRLRYLIPEPWLNWEEERVTFSITFHGLGGYITEPALVLELQATVPKWVPDRWIEAAVPRYERLAERCRWIT